MEDRNNRLFANASTIMKIIEYSKSSRHTRTRNFIKALGIADANFVFNARIRKEFGQIMFVVK